MDTIKGIGELAKRIRELNDTACCIKNNTSSSSDYTVILENILLELQKKKFDWEFVCLTNDGGTTVSNGVAVYDVTVDTVTVKYYINGVEVTGYEQTDCNVNVLHYDYEKNSICVDGNSYTKWFIWDKTTNIPTLVSTIWLNELDVIVPAPNPLLIDNINCQVACQPAITQATGDDLTPLGPSHSFTIKKPKCCLVDIVTSIGTFTMDIGTEILTTKEFGCVFTINAVTVRNGCDPAEIQIIGSKLS